MKILTILGARPQFIKAGLSSFNMKMREEVNRILTDMELLDYE